MIGAALREAVDKTPEGRERHVDLLRAVSIALVVFGHWLLIAITDADEQIDGVNALRDLQWAHPITWLFQVMPVFFFVGGYANLASWRSHREDGGDVTAWVTGRYERLVHPAAALLGVLVVAVAVAGAAGADREMVATAAWLATIPLWFLMAYLAIITLTPLTAALHDRWGLRVPIVPVAVAAGADVARFNGAEAVGSVNYLVVWLCLHQLGYAWRDDRPGPSPAIGWPLLVGGLIALVVVTSFGPYPVSVVSAPGQDEQNTDPPTLAILALGIAQFGLAYLTRGPVKGWLHRRRPWTGVVAVNAMVLTIFCWHMAAALVTAVLLYGTGLVPVAEVGTSRWLLHRIPWLTGCLLVLGVLVVAFAAVERLAAGRSQSGKSLPGTGLARITWGAVSWTAVAALLGGMIGVALAGPESHGPLGLPTPALVSYGAGFLLLVAGARKLT